MEIGTAGSTNSRSDNGQAEEKFQVSRIETKTDVSHELEIDKKNACEKTFKCREKTPDFPKDLRLNQILSNGTNVSFAQNEKKSCVLPWKNVCKL